MAISRAISFVLFLWVAFLLNSVSPLDFRTFGLVPRDPWGLPGIILMPFLHGSMSHLFYNSISLLAMLSILYGCISSPDRVSVACLRIILISGVLLWLLGRATNQDGLKMVHIGASGLAYGLVTFSFCCSIWTKNIWLFFASTFVLAYTGLSLFGGLLPNDSLISWDGHLAGAVAGVIAASIDHKDLTCSKPSGSFSDSLSDQ